MLILDARDDCAVVQSKSVRQNGWTTRQGVTFCDILCVCLDVPPRLFVPRFVHPVPELLFYFTAASPLMT